MCKCKQKKEWSVEVAIDEEAMAEGFDGELKDDTDTSDWVAYDLVSRTTCSKCGHAEIEHTLGAVWLMPVEDVELTLRRTVALYWMVPPEAHYDLFGSL